MALGFTIPVSTTDLYGQVITDGSTTIQVRPDKTLSRASKPKVHLATFGDGYEQRLADGINSVKEEFTVSFQTRPKADIDNIVGYLGSLKGATAFNFTIPDSNQLSSSGGLTTGEQIVKVVCDSFDTTYDYGNFYSASAKFRRVNEA
jgi:phage-related protein